MVPPVVITYVIAKTYDESFWSRVSLAAGTRPLLFISSANETGARLGGAPQSPEALIPAAASPACFNDEDFQSRGQ